MRFSMFVIGFALLVSDGYGQEIPAECRPPAWVAEDFAGGRNVHAVAQAPMGEDEVLAQQKALVAGYRRIMMKLNNAEASLLKLARMYGNGLPPGIRTRSVTQTATFVVDASEEMLLKTFAPDKGIRKQCWSDPCRKEVWCHTYAPRKRAVEAAESLLHKAKLETLLEESLRSLYAAAGPDAGSIVFYQVQEAGVAGKMGDYLLAKLEQISTDKRIFRTVDKGKLDLLLKKHRTDLKSLGVAKAGLRDQVAKLTSGILVGSYRKEGRTVVLDLQLLAPGGNTLASTGTTFLAAALPKEVEKSAKEEELARKSLALAQEEGTLAEERKKLEWEKKQWQQREIELRKSIRAELEKEPKPPLQVEAEVDQRVEKVIREEYADWKAGRKEDSPLEVSAWLDKGCGATYKVGEKAVLMVRCNRDCFVKAFHRAADNELQLIYPNKWDADNFLEGGKAHSIGDVGYAFEYEISLPTGAELITIVAAESQFDDVKTTGQEIKAGGGLASYGKTAGASSTKILTRGIKVKKQRPQVPMEATVARTTCPLMVTE